jgi:hypothetical protein
MYFFLACGGSFFFGPLQVQSHPSFFLRRFTGVFVLSELDDSARNLLGVEIKIGTQVRLDEALSGSGTYTPPPWA